MYPFFFFFNDTATTEIYTLSLHDALPICDKLEPRPVVGMHEGGACDEPRYPRVPEQHPAEIVIDRVDAEPFGRDPCNGAPGPITWSTHCRSYRSGRAEPRRKTSSVPPNHIWTWG